MSKPITSPMTEAQYALEQKRQKAADYLRSHNIHRADVGCAHQYKVCPYTPPPPRIDVSPRGNQPPRIEE